ncbi:MAG: sialidase family protein [Candidatus Bathyarchaeia archaeon]
MSTQHVYYSQVGFKPLKVERRIVVNDGYTGYFPLAISLDGQRIFGVLRRGSGHISADGKLVGVISQDGGETWNTPFTIKPDIPGDQRGPPALGLNKNGEIVLAFACLHGFSKAYIAHVGTPDYKYYEYLIDAFIPENASVKSYTMISRNGGSTWAVSSLAYNDLILVPYGKIVRLSDGTLIMNVNGARGNIITNIKRSTYVIRSRDGGKTWGELTLIADGFNEGSLLSLDDDLIIAAIRADPPSESIYISRSEDGGYSWSKPVRVTDELEHPADLIQLIDGSILMVYGHRKIPYGVRGLISKDGGKSWSFNLTLASDCKNQDCGYPTAVLTEEGNIVILYYAVGTLYEDDLKVKCIALKINEKELLSKIS